MNSDELSRAEKVEEVCTRFEAAWKAGDRPRIEDYLTGLAGAEPREVLRELILLDLHYRQRRGETCVPADYQAFPGLDSAWLEDLLRGTSTSAPDGSVPLDGRLVCGRVEYVGAYEVLELVAASGMARILRVRDETFERALAMKVPLLHDAYVHRRFLREAQITGRLQHPGIPPVHACGRLDDGRPYFVMKLIEGSSLSNLLKQRPSPAAELPRFINIFEQICQTMGYAHARGLIHRDLKPANVMVGAFGEVQVLDWGLAKEVDAPDAACQPPDKRDAMLDSVALGDTTQDGSVLGTAAYMAPEAARGELDQVDVRTDVFGLGGILCEILTGQPPYLYTGGNLFAKARSGDLAETIARLTGSGADAELVALARDCLATERERRPSDAVAVAARVAAYQAAVAERLRRAELDRAAAQARTEEAQATVRAERRARRRTVGLAAALVAVMVSLTVGGVWLQEQWADEARRAEELRRDVDALMAQAIRLRQGARFEDCRELLEQAQQRVGSDGPPDLAEQVAQALADTALAKRLDAAGQRAATLVEGKVLDFAGAEKDYAAALQAAGLSSEGEEAAPVATRVQASAVRLELVAALDDWASIAKDGARRAWLLAVVRAADPDPERDRLRQPKLWREGSKLARVAEEARVAELSPQLAAAVGRALLRSHEDAIPLLRKAQARHPDDFWLNALLGEALREAKQLDEAIGYFRAALALRPASVVHSSLADLLHDKGLLDEAIGHLEKAIRINPRYTLAHHNLGTALHDKGRLNEAIGHYEEALRINPRYALAHNNLGNALRAKGRLDEAIGHYEEALRIDPRHAVAHYNLGNALRAKDRLDEAIGHYEEALRIDPGSAEAHNNLGTALRRMGRLEEAIGHHEEALRINPKSAAAHTSLGNALRDKGRLDEAIGHYEEALRIESKLAAAHSDLGIALRRKGRLDEAIGHLEEALRINPRSAAAHTSLGNALRDKARLDEAIGHYEEALRINPRYAPAHTNLGAALHDNGQPDEAIGHYEEALRINPTHALIHYNLANALRAKGRVEAAVDAYRKAIAISPAYAEAHCNLGDALRIQGELRQALEELRRGHELGSRKPRWRYPSAQWVRQCERLVELEERLPGFLEGTTTPASPAERIELATLCSLKRLYRSSARFYHEAFAAQPKLAEDLRALHRYNAACAAALAAGGQGNDIDKLDGKERAQLRRQALDWLRADLIRWAKRTDSGKAEGRALAQRTLWTWQHNPTLASVRDNEGLATLPEREGKAWLQLWADVEALRKRAREAK